MSELPVTVNEPQMKGYVGYVVLVTGTPETGGPTTPHFTRMESDEGVNTKQVDWHVVNNGLDVTVKTRITTPPPEVGGEARTEITSVIANQNNVTMSDEAKAAAATLLKRFQEALAPNADGHVSLTDDEQQAITAAASPLSSMPSTPRIVRTPKLRGGLGDNH